MVGATSLVVTYNAVRPRYAPARLAIASFFAGWLTTELGLHLLAWQTFVVAALVWSGALYAWPGKLGIVLSLGSMALLLVSWRRSAASRNVVDLALADFDELTGERVEEPPPVEVEWKQLLLPLPVRHAKVECLRDIVYHEEAGLRLRLDVLRQRGADFSPSAKRPVLLFVHGGAWIIGSKDHQGLPMMHRLAMRGWVCFTINYRLSPRATFPDHVVDVKRAIAWVRAHAHEYGGDSDFIVISGGSAGGHLASLAALTPNHADLQPGFESADTSVAACVSFYGIYDFTDRHGHWPNPGLQRLLERYVMKTKLAEAPDRFEAASPVSYVGPHAPAFLVVHGECDSLVPVAEARQFVDALRASTQAPCAYIEVPGAQHAFEIFPSIRALHVLRGVERFAGFVHEQYLGRRRAAG
jgi:acetyl esterase/lipase